MTLSRKTPESRGGEVKRTRQSLRDLGSVTSSLKLNTWMLLSTTTAAHSGAKIIDRHKVKRSCGSCTIAKKMTG
jgi:hypothetical protein